MQERHANCSQVPWCAESCNRGVEEHLTCSSASDFGQGGRKAQDVLRHARDNLLCDDAALRRVRPQLDFHHVPSAVIGPEGAAVLHVQRAKTGRHCARGAGRVGHARRRGGARAEPGRRDKGEWRHLFAFAAA